MAIVELLPGMEPGHRTRNAALAFAYILTIGLWIFLLPLILAIAVAKNYRGWASALSRVPGINPTGGAKSGAFAFLYVVIVFAALGAAAGGSSDPAAQPASVADTTTTTVSTTTTTPTTVAPETELRELSRDGLKSGGFSDGVREIQVLDGDSGWVVSVRYDLAALGDPEDDEFDANHNAIEVLARLYQSEQDIQRVAIFAYVEVQDQYGNQDDAVVSKVMIDRDTAEKINWENILPRNIPDVADDYVFRDDYY